MINTIEIVSDGIILVFEDGTIKYFPESTLRKLDSKSGCCLFLDYDPSDLPDHKQN